MRIPNFFIVGAPKCGTTSMYTYLQQHPQVFMPDTKEPSFFATDLHTERWPDVRRREEYLELFSVAGNALRVGEASVLYLYSATAAFGIREMCPDARIIIMLRNPVDMIYALHSEYVHIGTEHIQDFEAALEAQPERKQGRKMPPRAEFSPRLLYYFDIASYADQVLRYFEVFGREKVHVVIFDDLRETFEKVYASTLTFLELESYSPPRLSVANPNKEARSSLLHRIILFPPPLLGRMAQTMFPAETRWRIRRLLYEWNTRYAPRKPMDPLLRNRLQARFSHEVEKLSQLLNRDLTHWTATA